MTLSLSVARHFERFLLLVLFSFKMYVFKEEKMSPMICIMLNPPQSLVFTKLLTEVLTLCACAACPEVGRSETGAL